MTCNNDDWLFVGFIGALCAVCLFVLLLIPNTANDTYSHRVWSVNEAETHAQRALDNLECNRTNPGTAAEAWAEANSAMPHGFEIIGQCVPQVNIGTAISIEKGTP